MDETLAFGIVPALLQQHKDDVIKVAERLLEQKTLSRDDIVELLGPRPFEENTEVPAGAKDCNVDKQAEKPKS